MALYYNISKLNQQTENDTFKIKEIVDDFVFLAETKLFKLEKAIPKKKHEKVLKLISTLENYLVLFDIDECIEYSKNIIIWAKKQGSKNAVEELFKVYKIRLEKAINEIRKDFKITLSIF